MKRKSTISTARGSSKPDTQFVCDSEEDILTIHSEVKVTFHKINTFKKTFKDYYSSFEHLHASLSPKYNRDMIFKAGKGAGRSGSFFFYSHDRKFIIKTMTKSELNLLLRILPSLSEHYMNNPDSLLAKIFGVFTIQTFRVD